MVKTILLTHKMAKKDSEIAVGHTVRIVHKGMVVNQTNRQTIDAIYVKKIDTSKHENTNTKTISGKVTDISMNTLTI